MSQVIRKSVLIDIISWMLIFLFTYTAVSKLLDFRGFYLLLSQTSGLSPFAGILAIGLPAIELLGSFLLLIPATRLKGMYISLFLMSVFTLYVAYLTYFASHRPCQCGGVIKALSWRQHLAFNSFFTLIAYAGIRLIKNSDKQPKEAKIRLI